MDIDSKLIFESYKKNQLVCESLRGLFDLLFSSGTRRTITFPAATLKEVESSLKMLETNLLKISYSSLANPRVFSDISLQLGEQIVNIIRTMANTVGVNQADVRGQLQTIAANYNQTLQYFLELSKSGLTPQKLKETIKEVSAGYDEVIDMANSFGGTSLRRNPASQIANNLTQLKAGLKEAEKFVSENAFNDRGKALLLLDWMKANKLKTIFSGLIISLLTFGPEDTGYGITKTFLKIMEKFGQAGKGMGSGGADAVKEEYPELTNNQNNQSNWPQIVGGGQGATISPAPVRPRPSPSPSPSPESKFRPGELNYE
jgi:hypothetical protein